MELYKITITPTSKFATSLKGDTLFGQMCWSVFHLYGKQRLGELFDTYDDRPFLIVSDAFASGYLPKPHMPANLLREDPEEKKINRKKNWLTPRDLMDGDYAAAQTDIEIHNQDKTTMRIHNALDYRTFHTGGEGFDPYGIESQVLGCKDIYFLLDESQLGYDAFISAFELLSQMGYGKKTTIGKGRFEFDNSRIEKVDFSHPSDTFMTLAPFSPKGLECENIYYEPFTRFGKFGGDRVHPNPFKKPVLLADTAAVITFARPSNRQYVGRAIHGLTEIPEYRDTVHQGYSMTVPLQEF